MTYDVYGIRVASSLPLPARPASDGASADIHVGVGSLPPMRGELDWFGARLTPDGEPWMSLARDADSNYLLRAHDDADFWVSRAGDRVVCAPVDDAGTPLDLLVLDQILPLVLHARGEFAFHGSAVSIDGAVVALLGRTGMGKSTLAVHLAGHGALFSDDCLRVTLGREASAVVAHAGPSCARLRPDSALAVAATRPADDDDPRKLRVALEGGPMTAPLGRICLLGDDGARVYAVELSARDAVAALSQHVFRLDHADRRLLARELEMLSELAQRVPVVRLSYPRRFEALPEVAAYVKRSLRAGGS